jgi:hypothetical protein
MDSKERIRLKRTKNRTGIGQYFCNKAKWVSPTARLPSYYKLQTTDKTEDEPKIKILLHRLANGLASCTTAR